MLRKLVREPLVHFVVLAALLFCISIRAKQPRAAGSSAIVVTSAQRESLIIGFTRTWMRPPTQEELQRLIEDNIREEIAYREAAAMGLDRDDTIVRRRMRQKFEFLTEDVASQAAPPSEQNLQAYLDRHPDSYRTAPKVSFEHIYFNREKRGKGAESDARAVLARLNDRNGASIDIDSLGDAFLLPFRFTGSSHDEIARLFGESFSKDVSQAEPATWVGPCESSYGLHLLRIHERIPGKQLPLAQVRESVLRDFMAQRRREALDSAYAKIRKQYTVTVEPPAPVAVAEKQ